MSFHNKAAATLVRCGVLCASLALGGASAIADPADYVFTPYADAGAWQVAYGAGTAHARDGSRLTQQTLSLGGAPSGRWYTSVYAAWAADDGGRFAIDEWAWTNHLKLTAPGSGPVDAGLLCELARPRDRAIAPKVAWAPPAGRRCRWTPTTCRPT